MAAIRAAACDPGYSASVIGYDSSTNGPIYGPCVPVPSNPDDGSGGGGGGGGNASPSPSPSQAPLASPAGANESPPATPVGPGSQPGATPGLGQQISVAATAGATPSSATGGLTSTNANVSSNQTAATQTNSSQSNDPVRLARGDLTTSDDDLSLAIDGIPLAVSRSNLGENTYSPSLSKFWSLNLDSRVIWGIKPLASNIVDDLRSQRQSLWDNYKSANQAYLSYIADLDSKISAIEDSPGGILPTYQGYLLQRTELRDNENQNSSRWNYYNNYVITAQNVVTEYTSALSNLKTARATFVNTYNWQISGLYFDWQQKDAEVIQAEKELTLSNANDDRSRYTWDSSQPSAWKLVGNGKIVILDEQGTPWVMNIQASPQYGSTSHYANGNVNYYPSGSELTGTKAGEHAWLEPDGNVHWKRRDRLEWIYDYYGLLSRIQDRRGNCYVFVYNGLTHLLATVLDKRGQTILNLVRDLQSRIVSVSDVGGRSVRYGYDSQGRLCSVTDSSGDTVNYLYTPENLLSRIIKPDGTFRENHYGAKEGRFVVDWQHDEEGNLELFSYQNDFTDYVTPQGVAERHYFNNRFLESRVEYPDGRWIAYSYNGNDLMTRALYSNGEDIIYKYDEDGNLIYRKNLDETVERWEHDNDHNISSYTDPRDNRNSITLVDGLPVVVVRPGQTKEEFSYFPDGKLKTEQSASGRVTTYIYDANGYLSGLSETDGIEVREQRFTNDALGRVTLARDPGGFVTAYAYYATDKLKRVSYPDGRLKYFVYNNRKDMVREELRRYPGLNGTQVAALSESQLADNTRFEILDWTDYVYDHRHLLAGVTNSLGEKVLYDYEVGADGSLSTLVEGRRIVDPSGQVLRTTSYVYDSSARVITVSDSGVGLPQPVIRQFRYDSSGRLAYTQDGRGVWTRYSYAPGSRVTAEDVMIGGTSPETGTYVRKTKVSYDRGLMYETADMQDVRTRFDYDSLNRLQSVQGFVSGQWQQLRSYDYDLSGLFSKTTDGRGFVTTTRYNAWGENTSVQDPVGALEGRFASTSNSFNPRGLMETQTDALGLRTMYSYDEIGRVTSIAAKNQGGAILSNKTLQYSYKNGQLLVAETDERGTTRTRLLDRLGRVIEETNGYSKSKHYRYNIYGKIDRFEDETGLVVSIEYDGLGRVVAQRRSGIVVGQWMYDGNGNVLSQADGEGRITTYKYDNFGRLVCERQGVKGTAAAVTVSYSYSSDNRRITKVVGDFTHSYQYDDFGRVASETDGLGQTESYEYDLEGNLTRKTDFQGQSFTFAYDPDMRASSVTRGNEQLRRYTYDAAGNVTSVTNTDGTLNFEYDIFGRMISQSTRDGLSYIYGYDPGGLRLFRRQGNAGQKVQYKYGREGELTKITGESGANTYFSYDDAMRLTGETRSNGTLVTNKFDTSGRLSFTKEELGSARTGYRTTWAEGYVYNGADQIKLSIDKDGLVTAFDYDQAGRLSSVQYPASGGKQSADRSEMERLNLDPLDIDRLDAVLSTNPADRSAADTMFNILNDSESAGIFWNQSVWGERFNYDSSGNRSNVTNEFGTVNYLYDQSNRLVKAGNRSYQYDPNGNLSREQAGNEISTYRYSWDNRVTSVFKSGSVEPSKDDVSDMSISYAYDGLGRRSAKLSSANSESSFEKYRYEGNGFILASVANESIQGAADLQKTAVGTEDSRYRSIDDFLKSAGTSATERSNHVQHFANAGSRTVWVDDPDGPKSYTSDLRGSVRSVVTEGSAQQDRYDYDAFGISIGDDKPELLGYTGKPIDPLTEAYDYGYRDYSPASARFTTVDPIQDGDNWYTYVENDPVNFVDIDGLLTFANGQVVQEAGGAMPSMVGYVPPPKLTVWPVSTGKVSSPWGPRKEPVPGTGTFHGGIDIPNPKGTAVVAAAPGTVTQVVSHEKYGNLVVIEHTNGLNTVSMHMSSVSVQVGELVAAGQQIGAVGSTGSWADGNHLHFTVYADSKKVPTFDSGATMVVRDTINPLAVLPRRKAANF